MQGDHRDFEALFKEATGSSIEQEPLGFKSFCQKMGEFVEALTKNIAPPSYKIPGPYDVAMASGPALMASGKYETPGAAWSAAWMNVPEFYIGRDAYLREGAALYTGTGLRPGEETPGGEMPNTEDVNDH